MKKITALVLLLLIVASVFCGCSAKQISITEDDTKQNTTTTAEAEDIKSTEENGDKTSVSFEEDFLKKVVLADERNEIFPVEYLNTDSTTGIGICIVAAEWGMHQLSCDVYTTFDGWEHWTKGKEWLHTLSGPTEYALMGNRLFVMYMGYVNYGLNVDIYEIDKNTGELDIVKRNAEVPVLAALDRGDDSFAYKDVYAEMLFNDNEKMTIAWKLFENHLNNDRNIREYEFVHQDKVIAIAEYDHDLNETVLWSDINDEIIKLADENSRFS